MDNYIQESLAEKKPKIYTKKAIEIGTALFGPFVAGYLLSSNFKVFGEPEKAKNSLLLGLAFTLLLGFAIFYIPKSIINKIPNELIPLINGGIAYLIVKKYQLNQIDKHLDSGGEKAEWWKTVLVGVIGVIVFFIPLGFFYLFGNTNSNIESMKFGAAGHEIYYDTTNVSSNQVKDMGDKLIALGVFSGPSKTQFRLKQSNDIYELSFAVKENSWNDLGSLALGRTLRDTLQSFYPDKAIVLHYVSTSFDDIKFTFGKSGITKSKKYY
jgi:hypothetical protein